MDPSEGLFSTNNPLREVCFELTSSSSCVLDQEDFPHAAHHKEVSIIVTNYTLRHSDSGLVIIGGSMEVQPQVTRHQLAMRHDGASQFCRKNQEPSDFVLQSVRSMRAGEHNV